MLVAFRCFPPAENLLIETARGRQIGHPQGDVVDVLVHDCISLFIPGLRRRSGIGPCRIRRTATSPDSAWAGIYMHILSPQYRSTAGRLGHPYTACRGIATSSCRPWGKGDQSPGDARAAHPFRHPGTGHSCRPRHWPCMPRYGPV